MRAWPLVAAGVVVALAGAALVLARRSTVDTAAPAGPQPAERVAVVRTDLAQTREFAGTLGFGPQRPVTGRKAGTVTWLPAAGAAIGRGERLYGVDARPVVLLLGATPLYRNLDKPGLNGPDVKVVEENLTALGFRDTGLPDERFTPDTMRAVKRWQHKLGVPETGTVDIGDALVLPAAVRVGTVTALVGGPADKDLLTVTGTTTVVTVAMDAAEAPGARPGTKVQVVLADGATVGGAVREVGAPVADTAGGGKSTVPVVIALDAPPAAGPPDVRVRFTGASRQGVLAVPVGALLALREGGYAVQTVEGGLVPVELGMFDRGLVEVSGPGLREGQFVVTTS